MKKFVFIVGLFMLGGCTVGYKMPDPPPAPVQRPTPAPRALTISDSVQLCQEIQTATDITIGCEFKYIDGAPAMFLLFPDYTTVLNSWKILTEGIAAPFCIAANSANGPAQLVLAVSNTKMARVYFCEENFWTEWVNYGDTKGSRDTRY